MTALAIAEHERADQQWPEPVDRDAVPEPVGDRQRDHVDHSEDNESDHEPRDDIGVGP